jgi:transposase
MELMSRRNWDRLDVIKRVDRDELSAEEASRILEVTPRWLLELRKAVAQEGVSALVHGNRGRHPANRLKDAARKKILELARTTYAGFNDEHFTEKLVEVEAIQVSRSSVRRLLREAKIGLSRKRRTSKHRRRRDRRPQAGLMILWDGSRHDWLQGRGPTMCLMGAIDDATGEVLPGAHFVDQEGSTSYLRILRAIILEKGIPHAAYGDRHGALQRNDDHWTLEEELRGEQDLTHVGWALRELNITRIAALSPQAKGRVERLWKTLQDRLVSELRRAEARTLEEANRVLATHLPDHNRRFAIAPQDATPAWRPVRAGVDVERLCSFRYEGGVGNDNAVRLQGRVFDIPPGPGGRSYAKARAEVRQLLDGSWRVYVEGTLVASQAPSPLEELMPLRRRKRSATDRAFRRAVRQLEERSEPPKAQQPRPRSRRVAGPPPFNSFGQLARRKQRTA